MHFKSRISVTLVRQRAAQRQSLPPGVGWRRKLEGGHRPARARLVARRQQPSESESFLRSTAGVIPHGVTVLLCENP